MTDLWNRLDAFINGHIVLGEPSWRQTPQIDDFFRIYREAIHKGLNDEQLTYQLRERFGKSTAPVRQRIEQLCGLIEDWYLYEQCVNRF